MVTFSIATETQLGLTWEYWKRRVAAVEAAGFAGLYLSDHFVMRGPPDLDSLDLIVALTYLASHTQHLHFGPLVAPLSFRHPVILARQAVALDELSNGRMILAVGTGHIVREHEMFGFELGDIPTRIARFSEGLEVITRLLRSHEPVNFTGRFFRLQDAVLATKPQRPGQPPILIGTQGGAKMLALVARYADIWNTWWVSPATFLERSTQLDEFLRAAGRQPSAVKRTVMLGLFIDHPTANLERQVDVIRRYFPEMANLPLADLLTKLRQVDGCLVGTPALLIEQLRAYVDAGAEEIILGCYDYDDDRWLRVFAEQVIPAFS
ncbi:MAG: LLM class flavin-dependent oxidoreductase [Chloroflexi bacterium]|nr:LLM class flavin-dependent oxidoreductase [Chloroflexota bacterium]